MRRLRSLLVKERDHHGWFFLATVPILLFVIGMLLFAQQRAEMGSALNAPRLFAMSLLILFEMIVCNRLVVQEFNGKTQLFLESLPLSRLSMIATKYVLGFMLTAAPLVLCFALSLLLQSRIEMISGRFAGILSLRLATYLFCTYSFFFMMGMLGRYRIAIYLLLMLLTLLIDQHSEFSFQDSGPLALINEQFAFERFSYPWDTLSGCGLAGVAFVIATILMATVREGGVAAMMAEKMSAREKSFVSIGLLTVLFIGSTLHAKKTKPPYDIETPWQATTGGVSVKAEESIDSGIAQDLVNRIHKDLVSVKDYLQIQNMPDVFLVGRQDLDGSEHETARLVNAEGRIFRINPLADDWDEDAFRSFVLDVSLSEATNFHAIRERQCWVLEGFVQYWVEHLNQGAPNGGENAKHPSIQSLRASYGFELGFDAKDAEQWYLYREAVSEPIASAVACRGLVYAEQQYGKEMLQEFLAEVLRSDLPDDSRSLWTQWRRPIDRVCKDHLKVDYAAFLDGWIHDLERNATKHSTNTQRIAKVQINPVIETPSGLTRYVNVAVTMSPPPHDGLIKLQYEAIEVVDMWTPLDDLTDHVTDYQADAVITLPDVFSSGDRIRLRATTFSEQLRCDVASPWHRMEIH